MMCLLETGPGRVIRGWIIGTDADHIRQQLLGISKGADRYHRVSLELEHHEERRGLFTPGRYHLGDGFELLVS